MHVLTLKKYFILFAVGLLACAGSREIEHRDIATGSFCGSGAALGSERGELIIAPAKISNGGFIITTPNTPYRMSAKDSTLLAALLNAPAPDKIADERNAQEFSVRVNIAFPKMTLQQAAELEARLKKLLPEAQEINLDLGQDVEVPVDEFYYVPEGVESRTVPGFYPHGIELRTVPGYYPQGIEMLPHEMRSLYLPPSAPREGLKPDRILEADSTNVPAVHNF